MQEKRWDIQENVACNATKNLARSLNVSSEMAQLLVNRGIDDFDKAKSFFRPSLDELHDPFLMKDMDKAVLRIGEAIQNNENILIYGDYDVDGTSSVSLVYSFIQSFYEQVDYYIPDRYSEGYGVSMKGIDYASDNDIKLIICLDCGTKAIKQIDYALSKGIAFIVCDHHRPGDELPKAVALLNPKQDACQYPYDELCGCGIGFKLCQAFSIANEIDIERVFENLDLVAIAIGCDIVPITGENRILCYHGIKQLNTNPRIGLKTIIELNDIKKDLTLTDLIFVIGPRINAAGRIEHGNRAVELLISSEADEALTFGKNINNRNLERRALDKSITAEALDLIVENPALKDSKSTVVFKKTWHKGVIGIVASRLTETYYRPTIVLTESNGKATGSARSVKGYDVYNAINQCSELLDQFGGHKYAAGLTMPVENVVGFQKKFEEVVSTSITTDLLTPKIIIEGVLDFVDIDWKFFNVLKQFAPFGPGNMAPSFVSRNVIDKGYTKAVGAEGDHLKLNVCQAKDPHISLSGIAFGMGALAEGIKSGKPFDIVYSLDENEWNGEVSIQLKVKDIKFLEI